MKRALAVAAALAVTGCAGTPRVDLCKGAAVRRQVYVAAIGAADALAASGRPVPQAVTIGREAAATALVLLDAHCPASPAFSQYLRRHAEQPA